MRTQVHFWVFYSQENVSKHLRITCTVHQFIHMVCHPLISCSFEQGTWQNAVFFHSSFHIITFSETNITYVKLMHCLRLHRSVRYMKFLDQIQSVQIILSEIFCKCLFIVCSGRAEINHVVFEWMILNEPFPVIRRVVFVRD